MVSERRLLEFGRAEKEYAPGDPRNLGLAVAELSVPIGILIAFGSPYQKATEWQRIGNQIDAAMIFGRTQFWSAAVLCRFSASASIAKCYCLRLKSNR